MVTTTRTRKPSFTFTSRNWDRAAPFIFEVSCVHEEVQLQLQRVSRVDRVSNAPKCSEIRLKGTLSSRSDRQYAVYVIQYVEIPTQSKYKKANVSPKFHPINSYSWEPPRIGPVVQMPVRSKGSGRSRRTEGMPQPLTISPGHSTALCSWPSYTATRESHRDVLTPG